MNFYNREIVKGYEHLKRCAKNDCARGDIDNAVMHISQLCTVSNQINWMFHDEELSCIMDDLSAIVFQGIPHKCSPQKKRVAFYDQYGKSFILALQYIDALLASGYEILYILSDYVPAKASVFITNQLQQYDDVTVIVIPQNLSFSKRAKEILNITMDFAPEKVFLHVKAFSVFNVVIPAIPRNICNYYIDLQDHAMWIKNHQIDYVLPYRKWGATIDIEKRGFSNNQVLLLPYYPIAVNSQFCGFPIKTTEKVVLFSGGEFYKTVDKRNTFWHIAAQILKENPSAVILFAIKGDISSEQKNYIHHIMEAVGVNERLILLGFRNDISEVFKHCDIYLGTSPMSGGLMCQYAALHSKPILQYYNPGMDSNNETEQVINYNNTISVSFSDIHELLREAQRLINNPEYRSARGKEIHECLISKDQFDHLFKKTIEQNTTQVPIELQIIEYSNYVKWWLYLEKIGISKARSFLLSILKTNAYKTMPVSATLNLIKNKISKIKTALSIS